MTDEVRLLQCEADRRGLFFGCCDAVIANPKFETWSGASKPHLHHYGKGGLALHTLEVVDLCETNRKLIAPQVDSDLLFIAAVFHDVGKIWDYKPLNDEMTSWTSDEHKRKMHHISRSVIIWNQVCDHGTEKVRSYRDEVTHCILAHHGQREWGSPVSPATRAAWLLHLCDAISARMNDCDKIEVERKQKW